MPPSAPSPPPACVRGTSAAMNFCVAAWNANGLFVGVGYHRVQCRGKLRMLRDLAGASGVVTLQETHGHPDRSA